MKKRQNEMPALQLSEDQRSLPLRESAYLALRKAILTGGLEPGEHLTEIHLGQMLGTSRTPVREAIRMLADEGLVTITRGTGARVAQITEEELQEVLELRCALDQLCARLAAERITEEGKEELQKALAAFVRAISHGTQMEIADADVAFHDVIIRAAGNRKIQGILSGLADNIYRYRYEFIRDEEHYGNLVREHRAICAAILAGDADQADQTARIHISRQWDSIRERLHADRKDRQSAG